MAAPRSWLAIPALAIACAGIAAAARAPVEIVLAIGALGAALVAVVRAYAGPAPAAAVCGGAAALLGTLALFDLAVTEQIASASLLRAAIAGAAGVFAIAELARPMPPDASPWPAIGSALVAGVLDPSYVALIPIASARFVMGPWPQPRWAIALPIVGVLGVTLAITCAALGDGLAGDLWMMWTARSGSTGSILAVGAGPSAAISGLAVGAGPPAAISGAGVLAHAGDMLGPITAVTAVGGLAVCAVRGRFAAAAALSVATGAIAVDLTTGTLGSAMPIIAAAAAGVGIARLTAMVRWPAGQAFIGAVAGFMMLVAPAWTLAVR